MCLYFNVIPIVCPLTMCLNIPYKSRTLSVSLVTHTLRQLQKCFRAQTHTNTIHTIIQTGGKWKKKNGRGTETGREHSNNLAHKRAHTHTHRTHSTSRRGLLHSLESMADLGLSPWVSSQPKGNMMARYWLFHCLPNNCILEYMQSDAVTCVQTKVQPFGCGHKMHSEAFLAHINLFQSCSITFNLKLRWENNGGKNLARTCSTRLSVCRQCELKRWSGRGDENLSVLGMPRRHRNLLGSRRVHTHTHTLLH